jgi:hypothetical protein
MSVNVVIGHLSAIHSLTTNASLSLLSSSPLSQKLVSSLLIFLVQIRLQHNASLHISDVRLPNVLFNVSLANKQQTIHALNGLQLLSTEETCQCILGDGHRQTPASCGERGNQKQNESELEDKNFI